MSRVSLALIFAFGLIFTSFAHARDVKYKDFNLELRNGDRLSLVAMKASVKLVANAKPLSRATGDALTVTDNGANAVVRVRKNGGPGPATDVFDQWTFSVRRDGSHVRIEAKGPEAKTDWEAQLRKNLFPEFVFEIEAPATIPVEVGLREGSINVQNWKASLALSLIEGQVRLSKNEGSLRAQVNRGEVRIDGHKGRTELDTFGAKIFANGVEGELNLDSLSGDVSVQALKGRLTLRSFSGQTSVVKSEGGVDFDLGRGSLTYQGVGSVRGQLDNGSVVARVTGDPEINVESQSGSVSVDIDAKASPSVRVQSEDGAINAPGDLPSSRMGSGKVVAGRLNGGGQGNIAIKTKTGNVRIF